MKNKLLLLSLLFLSLASYAQERQALGAPINTRENSEFAPTVSADGKLLIFESDRGKGWRLYMSNLQVSGAWSEPIDLAAINNAVAPGDFLGGPCLSYDGKTLFFTSNMKGTVGGIDIWYSEMIDGRFTAPKNLGRTINSAGYDGFPSLSPDGKFLYFMRGTSEKMPTGQYCCKLYVAKKQGKFFVNPVPLPYPVNTGCEGYPRIMSDGTTLIYSSYKPEGKGGYDLYQSRLKYGKWTKPVPLEFINTPKEDELVAVPESGDILYFSGQSNGKEDIYKIELPHHLRPEQVVALEGYVKDENNKPVSATIQVNSLRTRQTVVDAENDPETGAYRVLLQEGQTYDVSVTAKGHSFDSKVVNVVKLEKSTSIVKDITLKPLKTNTVFELKNIFFEFDSSGLSTDSYFELNRVLDLLKVNPTMTVEISAHTDDVGSEEYNMTLSQARAESVVKYLQQKGVASQRLIAKGYGESKPAFPNDTEQNRAQNRRVNFKILNI